LPAVALTGVFLVACSTNRPQPAATSATLARATEAAKTTEQAFRQLNAISQRAHEFHNPLLVYQLFHEHYLHSTGMLHGLIGQVIAAKESELGAYHRAVLDYSQAVTRLSTPPEPLPSAEQATRVDAADAIAERARDRHIVMVNEAHHAAQTRLLVLALLPRLRKLGFNWFAVEALSERDHELAARGYPVAASGSYVREPLYGEIIREALRLGYHVVAYEAAGTQPDPAQREHDQAQNLLRRVFAVDPQARLFVQAGYAHVNERTDYFFTDTLAMRLRRATGFDPLSVDQTILREAAPGLEYPGYRNTVERFAPVAPSVLVLRDSGRLWSLQPEVFDVSVILPPTRLVNGRADWLSLDGARVAVPIAPPPGQAAPFVIQARHANESADAVPADQQLFDAAGDKATLYLFPGDYRVDVLDAQGHHPLVTMLHVEANH
jgi:hypothetical protein